MKSVWLKRTSILDQRIAWFKQIYSCLELGQRQLLKHKLEALIAFNKSSLDEFSLFSFLHFQMGEFAEGVMSPELMLQAIEAWDKGDLFVVEHPLCG